MSRLINLTSKTEIAASVEIADTLYTRLRGLLGKASMQPSTALWIQRCNSIHTCFMNFPIDVVFVDRNLIVKATIESLHPWKLPRPIFSARSVFELPAGTLSNLPLVEGDQLYVGD